MKNKSVDIHFGGIPRRLIYDYNALAEWLDLIGTYRSSPDIASLKAVRDLVWAGLLAETLDKRGRETSRTLSVIEVGDILSQMEPAEVETLVASVKEARGISEPPKDEDRPTEATNPNSL